MINLLNEVAFKCWPKMDNRQKWWWERINLSVDNAVRIINELINHISDAIVYYKKFDHMSQPKDEPLREYVTHLESRTSDCNFLCYLNE